MQKIADDLDPVKYKLIKIHQICLEHYSRDYEMIFGKPLVQLPIMNGSLNFEENSTSNSVINNEDKKERQELECEPDHTPSQNGATYEKGRFLRKRKEVNYQSQEIQPHSFVNFKTMKKQPFEIEITLEQKIIYNQILNRAIFFLTLHSHLSRAEVIGLIGGNYNKDSKIFQINKIIPCKNIPTQDDFHNVEMDPISYFEAQNTLNENGLDNLGWYHSHPLFKTTPSQIDSQSHQFLSNHYPDNLYLGLIISPYKTDQKDSLCDIFIFFNQKQDVYRLNYKVIPSHSINSQEVIKLKQLYDDVQMNKNINWKAKWQQIFFSIIYKRRGKTSYQEKLNSSLLRILMYNFELGQSQSAATINDPNLMPLNINLIKFIEEHFIMHS